MATANHAPSITLPSGLDVGEEVTLPDGSTGIATFAPIGFEDSEATVWIRRGALGPVKQWLSGCITRHSQGVPCAA